MPTRDISSRTSTPPPGTSGKNEESESTSKKGEKNTSPAYITRSSSPTETPCDIQIKMDTQFSVIDVLDDIVTQIPLTTSIEEIDAIKAQADECHKSFLKEHSYLESRCTRQHSTSNYFKTNLYNRELKQYTRMNVAIAKKRREFIPTVNIPIAATATQKPQ